LVVTRTLDALALESEPLPVVSKSRGRLRPVTVVFTLLFVLVIKFLTLFSCIDLNNTSVSHEQGRHVVVLPKLRCGLLDICG
jgi:hypothetical protein